MSGANVIPFPCERTGAELQFWIAYDRANIARARWQLRNAEVMAVAHQHGQRAAMSVRNMVDTALTELREAIETLSATAAPTKRHFRMKRSAIGNIWLNAEGEWYDRLRSGVAADAARLGMRIAA